MDQSIKFDLGLIHRYDKAGPRPENILILEMIKGSIQ